MDCWTVLMSWELRPLLLVLSDAGTPAVLVERGFGGLCDPVPQGAG